MRNFYMRSYLALKKSSGIMKDQQGRQLTRIRREGFYDDLCVRNPYSRITCYALYLYSLEFGSPPLFEELNRVTRTFDTSELDTLGPMAMIMSEITYYGERYRRMEDQMSSGQDLMRPKDGEKVTTGQDLIKKADGVHYNLSGIMMLFRGALMAPAWVKDYEQMAVDYEQRKHAIVNLGGNSSTS